MTLFLLRRLTGLVVVMAAVSVFTFGVFFLLPGDPARLACGRGAPDTCVARARHDLGLDQPIYRQYTSYVRGIVAGRWYPDAADPERVRCPVPCLGISFIDQRPVTEELGTRLPATLSIAFGVAIGWVVLGCGSGVLAAMRRGSVFDRLTTSVSVFGLSVPPFLVGLVALYIFAGLLHWLPFGGYSALTTPDVNGVSHWYWAFTRPGATLLNLPGWAEHLLLPWLTLSLLAAGIYSRLTRDLLTDTLTEDFITTARAKGLPWWRVVAGHGLRAILAPLVTAAGIDVGVLLGGTALIENVYGINGVGSMLVDAVVNTDLPKMVGVTLVGAAFVLAATVVIDVAQVLIDPRVRTGERA